MPVDPARPHERIAGPATIHTAFSFLAGCKGSAGRELGGGISYIEYLELLQRRVISSLAQLAAATLTSLSGNKIVTL